MTDNGGMWAEIPGLGADLVPVERDGVTTYQIVGWGTMDRLREAARLVLHQVDRGCLGGNPSEETLAAVDALAVALRMADEAEVK